LLVAAGLGCGSPPFFAGASFRGFFPGVQFSDFPPPFICNCSLLSRFLARVGFCVIDRPSLLKNCMLLFFRPLQNSLRVPLYRSWTCCPVFPQVLSRSGCLTRVLDEFYFPPSEPPFSVRGTAFFLPHPFWPPVPPMPGAQTSPPSFFFLLEGSVKLYLLPFADQARTLIPS